MRESEIRLAMGISGSGTTMLAIALASQEGEMLSGRIKPVVVIADRPCEGIEKAKNLDIPVEAVYRSDFPKGPLGRELHGKAVYAALAKYAPDVVTLNGYLSLITPDIITKYRRNIYNQHPAPLDPDHRGTDGKPLHFGGKSIYGRAAHESVIMFQRLTKRRFPTEATIHRVTENFDDGPVVHREQVSVLETDTAETLRARVLPIEHAAHILFLLSLSLGSVYEQHRDLELIHNNEQSLLEEAKRLAVEKYPSG